MAQENKGRKSKLREESERNTQTVSSTNVVSPPITISTPEQAIPQAPIQTVAPPAPPIAPEVRDELTALMQDLLLKTHELSFEYSTMECDELSNCPLGKKAKELFRVVKKLNQLVRRMSQP
jgi:hypothetical protein